MLASSKRRRQGGLACLLSHPHSLVSFHPCKESDSGSLATVPSGHSLCLCVWLVPGVSLDCWALGRESVPGMGKAGAGMGEPGAAAVSPASSPPQQHSGRSEQGPQPVICTWARASTALNSLPEDVCSLELAAVGVGAGRPWRNVVGQCTSPVALSPSIQPAVGQVAGPCCPWEPWGPGTRSPGWLIYSQLVASDATGGARWLSPRWGRAVGWLLPSLPAVHPSWQACSQCW